MVRSPFPPLGEILKIKKEGNETILRWRKLEEGDIF